MEDNPSLPIIVHHFPPNKTIMFHKFPNRNGWWKKIALEIQDDDDDRIPLPTKHTPAKKSSICRFPKRGGTSKSSIFIAHRIHGAAIYIYMAT